MNSNEQFDGEIYLELEHLENAEIKIEKEEFWETGDTHEVEYEIPESTESSTIYKRKLASWKDITTLPKSRTKCVKMARVGPLKTCVGWKTQLKWYYRHAHVIVSVKSPTDIKKIVEDCIKTAAVAGAIAAIVSGGSAAAVAVEKTLAACLKIKLGSELLGVRVEFGGNWGSWS